MRTEQTTRRRTLRTLAGLGLAIALLCAVPAAFASRATERYIPLGKSPGVSGKWSAIGTIAEVNERDQTVTVAEPSGNRTIQLTKQTRIWLDRSALRQSNLNGAFADLQKGRRVEVKYLDYDQRQKADWVKVEITQR